MNTSVVRFFVLCLILWSCSTSRNTPASSKNEVKVSLDLVNVSNDKVRVVARPANISSSTITYQLPRIIPGTYAIQDYGRYVEYFKAFNKSGKLMNVTKKDVNTWVMEDATQLDRVEYLVNDSFDEEVKQGKEKTGPVIFSPAGTNILAGENFFLNLSGFVGYFQDQQEIPYRLTIDHPQQLAGTSALIDTDNTNGRDVFIIPRYAEVVDNPIMYAAPDISTFNVGGMDVYLHVYSPRNKQITSKYFLEELKKTMTAQKEFLGRINQTKKYAILAYFTSLKEDDAQGTGALEHNHSTSATFIDDTAPDGLNHVISHEFFHTLTPLNVHSKEIQYFNFNDPKMSQHLWMYEGFTEYFSSLFKVNKGLIAEQDFLNIMNDKQEISRIMYTTDFSMTEMSKNVVDPVINKLFNSVYSKGALAAMCMDIIIREQSNGKRSLLSVMGELSEKYGPTRAFNDDEFIPEFTRMTYPEVGTFIQDHIVGKKPIDYGAWLSKVGLALVPVKQPVKIALIVDNKPYYRVDEKQNKVFIETGDGKNEFVKAMGFENNDELIEIKGLSLSASEAARIVVIMCYQLKEGDPYSAKVIRNGKTIELNGSVRLNHVDGMAMKYMDNSKLALKEQWLKR